MKHCLCGYAVNDGDEAILENHEQYCEIRKILEQEMKEEIPI